LIAANFKASYRLAGINRMSLKYLLPFLKIRNHSRYQGKEGRASRFEHGAPDCLVLIDKETGRLK
jgi:hypothetical protein